MKPWAERFYKSRGWQECRAAFLQGKFYICERCGGVATIAHHIIYLMPENIHDPNITLNWNKLEALCQDCHNKEHGGNYTADGLTFNEFGDLVQIGS